MCPCKSKHPLPDGIHRGKAASQRFSCARSRRPGSALAAQSVVAAFFLIGIPGVRGADVVLDGPPRLEFLEGEPVKFELRFRNVGKEVVEIATCSTEVEVKINRLDTPDGRPRLLPEGMFPYPCYLEAETSTIQPGASETVQVSLDIWGKGYSLPPAGTYELTMIYHLEGPDKGPGGSPVYRYAARLLITSDVGKLREKLRSLASAAVAVDKDVSSAEAFVWNWGLYAQPYATEEGLRMLETTWQRLPNLRARLMVRVVAGLFGHEVVAPEPLVRRLAALRATPGFPRDLHEIMLDAFRNCIPTCPRPELEAAVKQQFGITIKPPLSSRGRDKEREDAVTKVSGIPSGYGAHNESVAAPEDEGVDSEARKERGAWITMGATCAAACLVAILVIVVRKAKRRATGWGAEVITDRQR